MVFPDCAGHTGVGTDHDKLLVRLETDLKESQQLVRLQQQLLQVWSSIIHIYTQFHLLASEILAILSLCLQDNIASPVHSELADSYFLEEWERLQLHWAELDHQRRTFERERQSFTDAAIRLSHEVETVRVIWSVLGSSCLVSSYKKAQCAGLEGCL